MELPGQTFRWRGAGGGEVIGFRISPAYVTFSDDLYGQIMLSIEAANPNSDIRCASTAWETTAAVPRKQTSSISSRTARFPDAELRFSTPQAFFDAIEGSRYPLPLVTEELQHTFPGCYSVMHDIKQQQQRGEHLLDKCERIVEGFVDGGGAGTRRADRPRLGRPVVHGVPRILAGTSIPAAWPSVRAMQGRARITGEEVAVEATRRWARRALPPVDEQQIVVLNPDEAPWEGLVEAEPFLAFDAWRDRWLSDLEGRPIEFQAVQPDAAALVERVVFPLRVEARQAAQVLVRTDERSPARLRTRT